jgi:hypothetical protein
MLYQLVAGEPPFRAPTPHAVMEMRLHKKAPLLRDVRPEAPAYLEAICAKCLALAASARFASIADVLAALDAGKVAAPASKPRPRWIVPAVAAGGLAAIGAVVAFSLRHGHDAAPPAPAAGAGSAPVAASAPHKRPADGLVTVLVLGFENTAGDPVFDGTLEHLLYSSLRYSVKIDPETGLRLRKLATELGPTTSIDDQLAAKVAERATRYRSPLVTRATPSLSWRSRSMRRRKLPWRRRSPASRSRYARRSASAFPTGSAAAADFLDR